MNKVDVLVIGAGPIGAVTAVLMAQAGLSVGVVEAGNPQILSQPASDGRAIALALSAKKCLEVSGFWPHLKPHAQPILDIHVTDGDSPFSLHYDHSDVGEEPFGWIIENEEIKSAALKRLCEAGVTVWSSTQVTQWDFGPHRVEAVLSNGETIRAALVVAAEGRLSPTRTAAAIATKGWAYDQSAIVCAIAHEKPHHGTAHEHFMPSGPFAILPMTDLYVPQWGKIAPRSGIVWTEKTSLVSAILSQSDADFLGELSEKVVAFLGALALAGPRYSYPLSLQWAEHFTAQRLCLVGDAAHGIHPIAGQGMNLGIRDAAALAQIVVEQARLGLDVGSALVLDRYQKWRRFDTSVMMGVTDGLNRLFSNRNPMISTLRDLGLWAVDQCGPAKKVFTRHAMGLVGDLPRPLQGLNL